MISSFTAYLQGERVIFNQKQPKNDEKKFATQMILEF